LGAGDASGKTAGEMAGKDAGRGAGVGKQGGGDIATPAEKGGGLGLAASVWRTGSATAGRTGRRTCVR